jgi:multidrug efflux pump subunit AcrA (membrane-fusion protein)
MKSLILVPVFLISLAACSGGKKAPAAEKAAEPAAPPVVKTVRAEGRSMAKTIAITGSLLPDETVNLGFEVPGSLAGAYTDFGRPVKKGQVLAELDRREISLQLERARAALAQALARVGLRPDQADVVPETTPAIRQAQAQADDARSKFRSAERLVPCWRPRGTSCGRSLPPFRGCAPRSGWPRSGWPTPPCGLPSTAPSRSG